MRKLISPLFAIILGFNSATSFANCQPGEQIDLRKSKSDIFRDIQIRNQEDYGICYAHAAATLIDFNRKLRKSDQYQYMSTDPIGIAVRSTALDGDGSTEGGDVCEVVNSLVADGKGCAFSGVSVKNIKGLGASVHVPAVAVFMPYILRKQKFVPINPLWYPMAERQKHLASLSVEQKAFLGRMDHFFKLLKVELQMRQVDASRLANASVFFKYFQDIYTKNDWGNLEGQVEYMVIQASCEKNNYVMPKLHCDDYSYNQYEPVDFVDESLRKGYPAGAGICSEFLSDKTYKGLKPNGDHQSDCGEHAVVIIGKRANGSTCQYLIRNSWGANHQYAWENDAGDVWVDEESLKPNFFTVYVVH